MVGDEEGIEFIPPLPPTGDAYFWVKGAERIEVV
jgi:hypothetical protein